MILQRNQSFPQRKVQLGEGVVSRTVEARRFVNPYCNIKKVTPYVLIKLLDSLHRQKYLTLRNSQSTYIKGACKLMDRLGSEKAVECVLLSAKYAKHPWSFKFILKLAEEHFICDEAIKEISTTQDLINEVCNG